MAVLFRHEASVQLPRFQAGGKEVRVVQNRVLHACLGQRAGERRFPNAFGDPRPARRLAEVVLDVIRQHPDLGNLIGVGNHRQDGLVIPAPNQFDLPALGELPELLEVLRVVFFQPLQQDSRKMQAQMNPRVLLQGTDEW